MVSKSIGQGERVEVGAAGMSLSERVSKKVPTQKLWATQKQSIFPCKQITCVYYGPAVKREVWKGVFTNTNGDVSRHLVLERSPDSRDTNKMRVGGVSESGEIHLSILDELWIPK